MKHAYQSLIAVLLTASVAILMFPEEFPPLALCLASIFIVWFLLKSLLDILDRKEET